MLFAPSFIPTCRLQMAMVKRANPNFFPSRWNHERTDPFERVSVANEPAFCGAVTKSLTAPLAADPRLLVRDITQPNGLADFAGDGVVLVITWIPGEYVHKSAFLTRSRKVGCDEH